MTWNRVRSLLLVSCIAAFVTGGCGQGSPLSSAGSPGTLVGPSALTVDAEVDVAAASAGTEIRHGNRTLTMANIQVGDHAQAKGTTATTTAGTTFNATEIKVEDMDHDGDDDDDDDDDGDDEDDDAGAKVEGKISGLAGTCPALTFNVVTGTTTTTTTKVTTNAATKFDDVLCTARANDKVVEVKGTKQADGSILATKVELE